MQKAQQSRSFVVYIYQGNGLSPCLPGQYDPLSEFFAPPAPSQASAFQWIANELTKPGSDMNALFTGVIIVVNKNNAAHLAETIASESARFGFVQVNGSWPPEIAESLRLVGFREQDDWALTLMLEK